VVAPRGAEPSERFTFVVHYRNFRNTDPPALVDIWNQAFTGRGVIHLRHSTPLEHYVFSKPYFDPGGLIVAEEDGLRLGFVHAGFGANADESGLSAAAGVTCLIGVRPSHRRQGIGSELLRRAEAYLRGQGAKALYAGPIRPLNPYYLGLYGGSELPGFLSSDAAAEPFFRRHGYEVFQNTLVFQRRLDKPVNLADGRFAGHRSRYELRMGPRKAAGSWWQEATLGLIEPFDFRLEEKQGGELAAQTSVWEMEGFSWRWNLPAVGLTEVAVRADLRRKGLAKFLLAQILRYLQDQFFGIVEVQTVEGNTAAIQLYRTLGFEQVDTGRAYRRPEPDGVTG
jgi:ribosomal protein S18 acetylase RimI-like enzyme